MKKAADIIPDVLPPDLFYEVVRPEDIAYTHSLFVQCFLPVRHRANNRQEWECGNRNAKMSISAGKLINPDEPGVFKRCAVPAGTAARDLVVYTIDHIRRHRTPVVPLGRSLRDGLTKMNIPIGGTSGKALAQELENFAAADITFGLWLPDGSAHQLNAKVAKRLSFWLDRNPDQGTLWQQELEVSSEFYNSVMEGEHITPIYLPAHVALREWPLAQDLHKWLVYRLRQPMRAPTVISNKILHSIFGGDTKSLRHFWDGAGKKDTGFVTNLHRALKYYPSARIEILNDAIKLRNSPPLIPYKKLGWIEGGKPSE